MICWYKRENFFGTSVVQVGFLYEIYNVSNKRKVKNNCYFCEDLQPGISFEVGKYYFIQTMHIVFMLTLSVTSTFHFHGNGILVRFISSDF